MVYGFWVLGPAWWGREVKRRGGRDIERERVRNRARARTRANETEPERERERERERARARERESERKGERKREERTWFFSCITLSSLAAQKPSRLKRQAHQGPLVAFGGSARKILAHSFPHSRL